jgi:hypothetical protein
MKKLLSLLVSIAAVALASCGGDGTILVPGGGGGGGGGGGAGAVSMGSGIPPAFTAGTIAVAVPNLSAGGSTSLSVSLVSNSALYTAQAVDVAFSSACIAQGLATVTTPVNTTTGVATTNYAATGCSGADVVTATATVDGTQLSATGTVTVAAASVGSIQFISATPENIGLQGTGGPGRPETSTVIFRVVDSTGGPVAGADVNFSLSTSVGGITLTPASSTSSANGQVQTVIQAGSVATSVRVTAQVVATGIATQSSVLTITTGLPDQQHVSLAVECPNIEAFNVDGVINPVTVHLADRFGNPVPDGTAVALNAEGGNIAGACTTTTTASESGVCTVNWTSANPRPVDGRVTIIATALGEESFSDNNGNGYFDDADSFADIGEPFRDDNENSAHDPANGEFFLDFNSNTVRDGPDGEFSGLLCGGPGGAGDTLGRCSANTTTAIGANNLIIMSGSEAVITDSAAGALDTTATVNITVFVEDLRGQQMPSGTTVSAEVTNGDLVGADQFTVACSAAPGPAAFPFIVVPDGTPSSGFMIITVETPDGIISQHAITVTD